MQSFNDSTLTFTDALKIYTREANLPLSKLNTELPESVFNSLEDPVDAIFIPELGILPIIQADKDYYVKGPEGLSLCKDPVESMSHGLTILDVNGHIVFTPARDKFLYGKIASAGKSDMLRMRSDRTKSKFVTTLYMASKIHQILTDTVLGNTKQFQFAFTCRYRGKLYAPTPYLSKTNEENLYDLALPGAYVKDDISVEALLLLDEHAEVFAEKFREALFINEVNLPVITTTLTSMAIQVKAGVDVRVLDHIFLRETAKEELQRKEQGE